MATSNTYNFGENTQIDDLLRESFERIGIIGNELTGLQTQSALMSANLELTAWQGKVPLSWTRKKFMFQIYAGQPAYLLPKTITRIVDVSAIQPQRLNSGGTATTTAGGTPSNCFDPAATAGCIQTAPNGSIGYDYGLGNSNSILYVGITPLDFQPQYTLNIEYSFDTVNWITALRTPLTTYYANQVQWWVVNNAINARAWRITETGGQTLRIQQIYFSQPTVIGTGDRYLTPMSYTEWMQITMKNTQSTTGNYFYDEQIQPTLTLWPVSGPMALNQNYSAILYTAYQYSQDVTSLFQQFDVPQRFYDALVAGLSARLALKFAPDRVPLLKQEAIEAFQNAAMTEFQEVTLRFQPDFSYYT